MQTFLTPIIKEVIKMSLFLETINEVAEEMKEQCDDLEKIVNLCTEYLKKYGLDQDQLKLDLDLILEGKRDELDEFVTT